jgi:hypothetical protein
LSAAAILGADLAEYFQPAVDRGADLVDALLQRQRHDIVGNLDRGETDSPGLPIEIAEWMDKDVYLYCY